MPEQTGICEQTLVTLMRGLGPWKKCVYLVGGLVPRYLIDGNSGFSNIGTHHVGTRDVDLALDFVLLSEVDAYKRLEQNLKILGFERAMNEDGDAKHYSWSLQINDRIKIVLDLLCDLVDGDGGLAVSIPNERRLSALQIPGVHLAIHDYIEVQVTCNLLGNRGVATETIKVANIVPFLVLKLLAYDDRHERKDAYDVIYCLMGYGTGPDDVALAFTRSVAQHPNEPLVLQAVRILRSRFASDERIEGFRKDGPVSYAQFLIGPGQREQALRMQRDAQEVVETFLARFDELAGGLVDSD